MAFLLNSNKKRFEESGHKCLAKPADANSQMHIVLTSNGTCNINTRDSCKTLKMSYSNNTIGNSYVMTSIAIDSRFLVNERLEGSTEIWQQTGLTCSLFSNIGKIFPFLLH